MIRTDFIRLVTWSGGKRVMKEKDSKAQKIKIKMFNGLLGPRISSAMHGINSLFIRKTKNQN